MPGTAAYTFYLTAETGNQRIPSVGDQIALNLVVRQPRWRRCVLSVAVEGAPKAVGPYAQAVVAAGFLYTAGQIPRDPATGNLVVGDIVVQTNRVLDNLEAVLKGVGCTLHDVVKVTVFITDLGDFAKMNEAFAARFGESRPARTTVPLTESIKSL